MSSLDSRQPHSGADAAAAAAGVVVAVVGGAGTGALVAGGCMFAQRLDSWHSTADWSPSWWPF